MSGVVIASPVALDHPSQQIVEVGAGLPRFIRVDATHELPLIVSDAGGRVLARFASPGEAALYIETDRIRGFWPVTLPAPIVAAWTAWHADLPRRERSERQRNAGAQ